jgi:primosomal protein N' (replication factor Y)
MPHESESFPEVTSAPVAALIAHVVPLTRTRAIRGSFDYRAGAEQLAVGSIVRVPFAGRSLLAVVVALDERSELPLERLASIEAVAPERLPGDLVALAGWLAREYCSTPARALSLMLPPGAGHGLREQQLLIATATPAGIAALSDGTRLSAGQRTALAVLSGGGEALAAEIGTALLRRLEGRGLVRIELATRGRRPPRQTVASAPAQAPVLTLEQQQAVQAINAALAQAWSAGRGDAQRGDGPDTTVADAATTGAPAGAPAPLLLHGVTGSGKTEVYLQAAATTLAAGRDAIILVPEIALTPQTLERFVARLGEVVAVMHSGMSDGARHDEWLRLARGEAHVCVGARSAVFAPLADIGLIVVDEEHESSYKHDSDPRYDARNVAWQRARMHGAVLLAGSATPRPESVMRCTPLRLRERADGRPLPATKIVDMRGSHHPLHPETRMALSDCRREHGKAVVLLNRRGWSNFLTCGSCGRVWMCPNCEVALVLHRAAGVIACHHCGHREFVPRRCPDCGSVSIARHGAGTERLERELFETLATPDFPVLRLDADASDLSARAAILARFQAAPAGVLVGTQMIAKGHDFSGVTLGVVLDADQTLRFPDFRAEERTFALITQLAGRTGRGSEGRVLVQTQTPTARAIRLAAAYDSDTFLRGELRRRKALGYPPFATLIRLVCASPVAEQADAAAAALRGHLKPRSSEILGPAPLFMLRGQSRVQLLVKTRARTAAIVAVGAAVEALAGTREARGVAISVDVDPI